MKVFGVGEDVEFMCDGEFGFWWDDEMGWS